MFVGNSRFKFIAPIFLAIFVGTVWFSVFLEQPKNFMKAVFFDIGQGDAMFLETPLGVQALFDGGPDGAILNKLGKEMAFYDRKIDFIFISHFDSDHIGGLIPVLEKYRVSNVIIPDSKSETAIYRALLLALQEEEKDGAKIWLGKRGDVFDLGSGVKVRILFPDRPAGGLENNTASLVTQIIFGQTEILLTGDLSKSVENYLVYLDGVEILPSEILKAGHHGSKTSSGEDFLRAVSADYFVVSAGRNNKYNHPHPEVLALVKALNLNLFRTDELGDVRFFSDGVKIWR